MDSSKCNRCGKNLTKEESRKRGYGPICWGKINTPYSYQRKHGKIPPPLPPPLILSAAEWAGCAAYPTLCPAISGISKLYMSYKIGERILNEWEKNRDSQDKRAMLEEFLSNTSYPLTEIVAHQISSEITSSLKETRVLEEISTKTGVNESVIITILEKTINLSLRSTGNELINVGVEYSKEGV